MLQMGLRTISWKEEARTLFQKTDESEDCKVFDDGLTEEQWQDIFGDDDEDFLGLILLLLVFGFNR